ncbi:MAG: hypothetical protein ACRD4E_03945 [Bryobacteraceae bacterium]
MSLRISIEAKRVTQRAQGAWIYLRDENDTHYEPTPNPSDVPLDVQLQPGESVAAQRSFQVPANGGCLFHKQAMIRLPIE